MNRNKILKVLDIIGTGCVVLGLGLLVVGVYGLRHREFYVTHAPGCGLSVEMNESALRVNCEQKLVDSD